MPVVLRAPGGVVLGARSVIRPLRLVELSGSSHRAAVRASSALVSAESATVNPCGDSPTARRTCQPEQLAPRCGHQGFCYPVSKLRSHQQHLLCLAPVGMWGLTLLVLPSLCDVKQWLKIGLDCSICCKKRKKSSSSKRCCFLLL